MPTCWERAAPPAGDNACRGGSFRPAYTFFLNALGPLSLTLKLQRLSIGDPKRGVVVHLTCSLMGVAPIALVGLVTDQPIRSF